MSVKDSIPLSGVLGHDCAAVVGLWIAEEPYLCSHRFAAYTYMRLIRKRLAGPAGGHGIPGLSFLCGGRGGLGAL